MDFKTAMAMVYIDMINNGLITLASVPAYFSDKVKSLMET